MSEFWKWLDEAYADGSKGEQPKFTKYNMEVAYEAGRAARTAPAEGIAIGRLSREAGSERIVLDPIGDPHIKDGMVVYTAPDALHAEVERLRDEVERLKEAIEENNSDAAVAAIKYALEHWTEDPVTFLECWMDGDFSSIREEWDDVPDEVFIGADPLFKRTAKPEVDHE